MRGLTQLLHALQSAPLDDGSEHFGPSSLEVVSVDVGNPAWNVIPAKATARFNSRYNDRWTRETLQAEIERRLVGRGIDPALSAKLPIRWTARARAAVVRCFPDARRGADRRSSPTRSRR